MDTTIDQIATSVARDPGLSARALAAFGGANPDRRGRLPPLTEIMDSVGRRTLQGLAISARVCAEAEESELARCRTDALRCALIARGLAEAADYPSPDEAYVAGLLHNIDQLILLSSPDLVEERPGDSVLDDIERSGELGAAMIAGWGLGPVLADAVRYCHEPEEYVLDAHPLVRFVHLAAGCVRDAEKALQGYSEDRVPGVTEATVSDLLAEVDRHLAENPVRESEAEHRRRLEELVREFALFANLKARAEDTTAGPVGSLAHDVWMMTGVRKACRFMVDQSGQRLRSIDSSDDEDPLSELRIRREGGHSLLGRALATDQIVHSFDHDTPALNVADRQIASCMGASGLVCVPLIVDQEPCGVLVLGVERNQVADLLERGHLLRRLGAELEGRQPAARRGGPGRAEERERLRRIVHEVNNPLSIVRNYLKVLGLRLEKDHPAASVVEVIEDELVRASSLVQQIVGTDDDLPSRKLAPVRVNALVADLVRLSEQSLPESGDIKIVLGLDETLPPIMTDADAVKQILTNLMSNALEAMGDSGRLTVKTRDWGRVDGTPSVELEVTDTGPGIPAEMQDTLFRPGPSTKGGDHAGLGLSIVKRLVDELDGSIRFRSKPGEGTTFQVMLPRRAADESTAQQKDGIREGPQGDGAK